MEWQVIHTILTLIHTISTLIHAISTLIHANSTLIHAILTRINAVCKGLLASFGVDRSVRRVPFSSLQNTVACSRAV